MTFPPVPGAVANLHGLKLTDTSGVGGYALQDTEPVAILTWTAPDDGELHQVMLGGALEVTEAQAGGQILLEYTLPDGATVNNQVDAGSHASTGLFYWVLCILPVQAGSTVTLWQTESMTAGTATAWVYFWAS
jgi:hypothetical protein